VFRKKLIKAMHGNGPLVPQNSSFSRTAFLARVPPAVMPAESRRSHVDNHGRLIEVRPVKEVERFPTELQIETIVLAERVFLPTPTSVCARPGPMMVLRPFRSKRSEPVGKFTKALDVVLQPDCGLSTM